MRSARLQRPGTGRWRGVGQWATVGRWTLSAAPALVALFVGSVAAAATTLGLAGLPGTLAGPAGSPPPPLVEHGSVLAAPPALAQQLPPAPPSTSPPPTTTEPAPPPPTTQPPPAEPDRDTAMESEVVAIVNQERAAAGCNALAVDERLANAAQSHSSDMADRGYFSHTTPEGKTFVDRARAAGYPSPGGENIAMGQRSPQQVMDDWMNSDGHRRNILNCEFRTIGVGLDTDGWYWTQVFGR
jgi:uncharacterized protein YkwD